MTIQSMTDPDSFVLLQMVLPVKQDRMKKYRDHRTQVSLHRVPADLNSGL